jgi:hypothetical protein
LDAAIAHFDPEDRCGLRVSLDEFFDQTLPIESLAS